LSYHTFDSRRSTKGFPDLILARPGEALALELKSEKGVVRPEQQHWIDVLEGAAVEAQIVRPVDLQGVLERLVRLPGSR